MQRGIFDWLAICLFDRTKSRPRRLGPGNVSNKQVGIKSANYIDNEQQLPPWCILTFILDVSYSLHRDLFQLSSWFP